MCGSWAGSDVAVCGDGRGKNVLLCVRGVCETSCRGVLRRKKLVKLTLVALVVLEGLEGHEGTGAGDDLVGELCLVVRLLDAVVVVLGVVCGERQSQSERLVRERKREGVGGARSDVPKPNMFAVDS